MTSAFDDFLHEVCNFPGLLSGAIMAHLLKFFMDRELHLSPNQSPQERRNALP